MKYLVLFLMSMFPLLSISAQNLEKMDSVQRNKYLIDLSSEVIKTMGPGSYLERYGRTLRCDIWKWIWEKLFLFKLQGTD